MDPTIVCPSCKNEIKLTESLAAPLIEATRKQYEKRLAKQNADVAARELELKNLEEKLTKEKETIDAAVKKRVDKECERIAVNEAKKARLLIKADLDEKAREIADLNSVLRARDEKLAEAQKAQALLLTKQRELDDAKREMELTIETRVQQSLEKARAQAKKEAESHLSLKLTEKEQTIASMQKKIEELKAKAEQGSQQLQGEALELQLEGVLAAQFIHDRIAPVPKGEYGGDILQRVNTPAGIECGTILWETKRTRNWSDGWLAKLRSDQRTAKAEIAAIVSAVLPKGMESFDQVEGVWVVHPRCLIPVAMSLRHMLIEVHSARRSGEGQQTKMELLYQYLTGPSFRLRVQAIVEAFSTMAEDLQREKKAIMKQWSKREEQIHRVMEATVGMYGEMQGIAGKTLQEIDGLELPAPDEENNSQLLGE